MGNGNPYVNIFHQPNESVTRVSQGILPPFGSSAKIVDILMRGKAVILLDNRIHILLDGRNSFVLCQILFFDLYFMSMD